MIQIDGLSERQVELLAIMWTLQSPEEYDEWKDTLNLDEQNEVDSLARLVLYETLERNINNNLGDARKVLSAFVLHK
jgi:hypothetical protein